MQALESLERDQQLLQGLAEALEVYVAALEAGQPLREGDLRDLVQGFRTFADYHYFEKVEEVLIPGIVRNGFDYNLGVLGDERLGHDQVRYLIEVLYQSAERELNWSIDERRRIASAARHLVEAQRQLVTREQLELFPEIMTRLGPPVLGQLTQQLCQFDELMASRESDLDVPALSKSVLARYSTLPPPRELTD